MSRSRKKIPCWKDGERSRTPHRLRTKTFANRSVRRNSDIPSGCGYKRVFNSYIICDYKFIRSEAQLLEMWESGKLSHFSSYAEARRSWFKSYISK